MAQTVHCPSSEKFVCKRKFDDICTEVVQNYKSHLPDLHEELHRQLELDGIISSGQGFEELQKLIDGLPEKALPSIAHVIRKSGIMDVEERLETAKDMGEQLGIKPTYFITESNMKDLSDKAKRCSIINWLSFTKDTIEIHYDDPMEVHAARKLILDELNIEAHLHDRVKILREEPCEFTFNTLPVAGDPIKATLRDGENVHLSIGAFCKANDILHVLTASHGQIKPGKVDENQIRLMKDQSVLGSVEDYVFSPSDGVDVALVSFKEGKSLKDEVCNQVPGRDKVAYSLVPFTGAYENLAKKVCFKFEPEFENNPGTVEHIYLYFKPTGFDESFAECVGILHSDLSKLFSDPNESGKVIVVKDSDTSENDNNLRGFGLLIGQISKKLSVACNFVAALKKLNDQDYCNKILKLLK